MTIYDVMRARRSIRRFKPESPAREAIERLIAAAVTAPSASNKQPWRFVVVTSRSAIALMARAVREAVDRIALHVEPSFHDAFAAYGDYFTRFETAPVVIAPIWRSHPLLTNLVGPGLGADDRARIEAMERDSALAGTAMALENLLLAAHEAGLGASAMTGPLVAVAGLREILAVPPSWNVLALVPVGYPDEVPEPVERKPAELVTRWVESP